jgi:hypothetical protein
VGVDINALKLVLLAKKQFNCDFSESLMIGRQRLYITQEEIKSLFYSQSSAFSDQNFHIDQDPDYFEWVIRLLGAKKISALDVSDYEKADVLHDLNKVLPAELFEKYTCVMEFGTLEHVFNFPEAISSLMKCLKIGGQIITYTVANNFCGHGFYQFSPELFFRVFDKVNGFVVKGIFITEAFRESSWYSVDDPAKIGQRVELFGPRACMICCVAEKVEKFEGFKKYPMQSDYVSVWTGNKSVHADHSTGIVKSNLIDCFRGIFNTMNPIRILRERQITRMFKKPYFKKINQGD